jgi:DNA-binding NarL/FixJ family response regulator
MFRQGVAAIVAREPRLLVVGEGSSSEDALELAAGLDPDVLVLDVELGGAPAATTISTLRRRNARTKIVVLTMHRDSVLRRELLRVGATDFITKSVPAEALLEAMLNTCVRSTSAATEAPDVLLLSDRQHDVLVLMAQAKTNKAIAAELRIAEGTVKRHASNLFAKLHATSRMDAVQRGRLLGILD